MNKRTLREHLKCAAAALLMVAAHAYVLSLEQRITELEPTHETQTRLPTPHPPTLATAD